MTLISMQTLLETAKKNKFAVGYFEAWDTYSLESCLQVQDQELALQKVLGGLRGEEQWRPIHRVRLQRQHQAL